MKKAQMFIITMVFLIGLIFVIQQGFNDWFEYSIDFSASMQRNDYYIFDSVRAMSEQTLKGSQSCLDARDKLRELEGFLKNRILSGYYLDFSYKLTCANWDNAPPDPAPMNLTLHITGKDTDTHGNFFLYRL
jgi:hypothetical protein